MVQFQSFADISTVAEKITMITVYAGGNSVFWRTAPQFLAYKYYKLGPVTIKLIPASTLPVDPTGLSMEAGANTVDPRDQLTPGLVRITNGEDFFTELSGLTADTQHNIFNTMMLDERWFKWSLQSGITKTAEPRYWMIGQIRQDYYPGAVTNIPADIGDSNQETNSLFIYGSTHGAIEFKVRSKHSSGRGIFQTGQHGVLGWMPTDALIATGLGNYPDNKGLQPALNAIPQVELFRIILPPAYKTRYYYRMFVTETVDFKDAVIQNVEVYDASTQKYRSYAPADRFIRCSYFDAKYPSESTEWKKPDPNPPNDAANTRNVIDIVNDENNKNKEAKNAGSDTTGKH